MSQNYKDTDPQETQEWLESIDDALEEHGYDRTRFLLEELIDYAQTKGARLPFNTNTPFINTIQPKDEPEYPGCLLYTSPSPRDSNLSRMPSSA